MRVQLNIKYGSPFKAIAMSEVDRYPYNDYGYVVGEYNWILNMESLWRLCLCRKSTGIPTIATAMLEVDHTVCLAVVVVRWTCCLGRLIKDFYFLIIYIALNTTKW